MAATGFTPVYIYASGTTGNIPSASNLTNTTNGSEIALNYFDGKLFYKNASNSVVTVPLLQSSGSQNGWLSSTDWTTFNNKQPAGTYVTSVTGTSPVVSSGGTTPAISMAAATSSVNGYLTSTDWSTFNGKQAALVSGTNIKTVSGTTLLGSGDLGTIGTGYGGTGLTSFTSGGIVYASSTSALATGAALKFDGTNFSTTGSATAKSFIPSSSTIPTNGLFLPASNIIGFATNSTQAMQINASGNVSIGTTTDGGTLYISGGSNTTNVTSFYKPNSVSNNLILGSGTTTNVPAILIQGNGATTAYWYQDGNMWLPGGTSGIHVTSDIRLKKDITYLSDQSIPNYKGLNVVLNLKPVTFRYKTDEETMPLRRGWIAQDFEKEMPELVSENTIPGYTDNVAYKSIADGGLVPVLVAAIQELNNKINLQAAQIQQLLLSQK